MKMRIIDIIVHVLCLLLIIASLAVVILAWRELPEQIPTHFGFNGEIDGYGGKGTVFLMPGIMVVSYILMTVVEFFPGTWNTGVKVTARNREKVYGITKNLLITVKLTMVAIFAFLSVWLTHCEPLPGWFLPVSMAAVLGGTGYWSIRLLLAK